MTAEREAMTLECAMEFLDRVNRGLISGRISEWPGLREACGVAFAHLSRDEEPVARVELDETSHAYVKWLCGIHECIGADLYTHSPETARDAKDAAWKDIGDGYEVSCTGRVRRGSRELIPYAKAKGYVAVSLWRGGERREEYVHRLVAGAFCDRGSGLQTQVNHRDGDKTNNYASNLEWCSPQENRIHAARVLFTDTRPVIGTCIATGEDVRFRSLAEAEEHGFIRANIQKCIAGKRKKHGGYTWRDAAMAQESDDAT